MSKSFTRMLLRTHVQVSIFLFVALCVLYVMAGEYRPEARLLPRLIMGVTAFLVLLDLALSLFKKNTESKSADPINYKNWAIFWAAALILFLLYRFIGFEVASAVYLSGMIWLLGYRNIKMLSLAVIGIVAFNYIVFVYWLKVPF